jgi:ABC-type phosphate transport system substrate-binding protein
MKIQLLLLINILLFIYNTNAQVAVIAYKSAPINEISSSQLLDFYTGDVRYWSNDDPVVVFDLEPKGEIKKAFYNFLGKSTSRMKSIWMKRMLSGEGNPPEAIKSEEELLKKVAETKGAVGFISYDKVSEDVKVLAKIEVENE